MFERNAEFIFILNNDTAVHPYVLKALVLAAEKYPPAGIVAPKIYLYGDSKKLYSMRGKWIPEKTKFIYLGFGELDLPQHAEGVQEMDYGLSVKDILIDMKQRENLYEKLMTGVA